MKLIQIEILILLIELIQSASIHQKDDTLEILKKDVTQVGSAIENITFDILKGILEQSSEEENQETTTIINERIKRSAEEELQNLCHKRCEESQKLETKQIKDLKHEVEKLQEVVKLLQDQQTIINILDKNSTKTPEIKPKEARTESETEDVPYLEELSKIKNDVKEIIKKLNQTRELINLQKKKDEILEEELIKQKQQIIDLRTRVETNYTNDTILQRNEDTKTNTTEIPTARASEFSDLRKLLKNLPDDDDDTDDELSLKIKELERNLSKKKKKESLLKELKQLEKSIDQKPDDNTQFFQQFLKALKKTEPKSRTDLEINNLSDLKEAIDRLRPKEDETTQFQAMLTKLISAQNQRPSQFTVNPQQISDLNKKLNPPVCIVDDGSIKNNAYKFSYTRNFPASSPVDYNRNQQFFPASYTQPSYYPQGNPNGNSYEKPGNYQPENGDFNQKYQNDLRQQIDGLQEAIDNLNRPEYMQRPEDKAVVDDLERQIGDLRNIVNNLNYDPNYQRTKRSLEDNEVDDGKELVEKFVGELLQQNNSTTSKPDVKQIQEKIQNLRQQLDDGNSKTRAASTSYYPPALVPPPLYLPDTNQLEKSSLKTDFFTDIVGKIIDKILQAIPVVLQKLFNFSVQELSKYDPQDYDLQVLYKNLGIFAHLPIILLRLLRGFSAFINMLRKNSLFRNFLLPAIILATVAGSVLFLIWWLQPDGYQYGGDGYDQGQNYQPQQQYQQNPQYPVSYNTPVYNRSYFTK